MPDNRNVWIKNNSLDVNVHCGVFKVALVYLLACIACGQCSSDLGLKEANELRKQQLEVAKKQYQLDSLRYYAPIKQR